MTPDRVAEARKLRLEPTHHPDCPYCDRLCERCRYPIPGGWTHVEQPQAPESNVVVCNLKRYVAPLVGNLTAYFDHKNDGHLMTESELHWRRGF